MDAVSASPIYGKLVLGKEVLDTFAYHYKTRKKLPTSLFKKLLLTKNYNSGLALLRQIEFSLFDFLITCR